MFDRVNGTVVKCRSKRGDEPVTLCAGTASNPHITVSKVTVWDNESNRCLYCGPLQNPALKKVLTEANICGAELTNAAKLENGTGRLCCYGEPDTCRVTDCPFKTSPRRRLQA